MIVSLIDDAVADGARRARACAVLGVSARTLERWRGTHPTDVRPSARRCPANALTAAEPDAVLTVVNSAPYRDCSPHQIVPRLADTGVYLASESTRYRVLRAEQLLAHRGRAAAPVRRPPQRHEATGPNQVWSWDITYLKTPVRGVFFYLYLIVDMWSRKIVGWQVCATENADDAAALVTTACHRAACAPPLRVLHADNGGPMKGATMVVTLERLGVLPSFSRPG